MATFFTARMLTFGLSWLRIESESTIAESNESNETARSKVYGIQQIPTDSNSNNSIQGIQQECQE